MTEQPPAGRRGVPPWQILVPVVLLGLIGLVSITIVLVALARGAADVAPLLIMLPVALLLAMIAVGLWQRRRGARLAGFLVGLALIVYGVSVSVAGAPALELLVGLAIAILLASKGARRWVSPG
jgi:hypothetical protein